MAGHIFQHIQDFITGLLRPRLLPREAVVGSGEAGAGQVTWADSTYLSWGDGTLVEFSV